MKRGCLIVLVAVPLLLLAGLAYGYVKMRAAYGLAAAGPISAETVATEQTRLRLAVAREKLVPFLKSFLPGGSLAMPWYASFMVSDPLEEFLPYEAALLGGADYKDNRYRATLFVNERVLGPVAVDLVRDAMTRYADAMKAAGNAPEAMVFRSVDWQEGFIDNAERGKLVMSAGMPLPAGMQNRVLQSWEIDKGPAKNILEGGHLIEGVLDNTSGDLMALIGTLGKIQGQSLDQVFAVPQITQAVKAVDTIRLHGNLTGDDELTVIMRIALNTDDFMTRTPFLMMSQTLIDGSGALETLLSGGQQMVTPDQAQFKGLKLMAQPLGITVDYLNGEKPVFDGNDLVASYLVTGFRPLIQQRVDDILRQLAALQ